MQSEKTPLNRIAEVVEREMRQSGIPPLTDAERQRLYDDLGRAPILHPETWTRLRNEGYDLVIDLGAAQYILSLILNWRNPRSVVYRARVGSVTLPALSVAGLFYAMLLRGKLDSDEAQLLSVEPWQRDDIPAIHQVYLDLIEYTLSPLPLRQAVRKVSRLLYAPGGAGPELDARGVDWRRRWMDRTRQFPGLPAQLQKYGGRDTDAQTDVIVTTVMGEIQAWLEQARQKELSPGSSEVRASADDFDRRNGQLSAECDAWTHQELEAWTRERLDEATVPEMCAIVKLWSEYLELEGECGTEEEEQKDELWSTLLIVCRLLPKRLLCLVGAPPPATAPPSLEAHNLHVLQTYLPLELLPQLRQLVGKGTVVGRNDDLIRFVFVDLRSKIALTPSTYVVRSTVNARFLDARNSLALGLGSSYADTHALIVVVLAGEVSISAVSTNQVVQQRGTIRTVVQDHVGVPLPSQHLLLGVGGMLALTWNIGREDVYDFVVVRTTDRAEVVIYEFSGS